MLKENGQIGYCLGGHRAKGSSVEVGGRPGRDNAGQSAPGGPTNGTGTPPALCNGGEIDRWAVGNGRGIRSVRLAGTGALRLQLLGPHVAGPNNQFWGPDNDIAIEDSGLATGPN